jgi:hypothetical protein
MPSSERQRSRDACSKAVGHPMCQKWEGDGGDAGFGAG